MTSREKEILKVIRDNPLISQQDLANSLGLKRSSVAVHIGNLMKKGHIKGRGYILNNDYVTVIGGSNIDIQGFSQKKLIQRDSNPGNIMISVGGVGRNIADNLSKLQVNTNLISAVGKDIYGDKILKELRLSGIGTENILISDKNSTSTYLSVLDNDGDMNIGLSDMKIFEEITPEFIYENIGIINNSKILVLDTNLSKQTIDFIVNKNKDKDIIIDTVSTTKAKKISDILGEFHTLKPNKYEAEVLSGMKITNDIDLKKVGNYFIKKGVKNIIITLGKDGIYYQNNNESGFIKGRDVEVVNATGAGDAFTASIIYSYMRKFNLEFSIKFSMAASILALSHKNTINPNMNIKNIKNTMKEMNLC